MTTLLIVASAAVVLLLAPRLAAMVFDKRAPARSVATFHFLVLVGLAMLPIAIVSCVALVSPRDLHRYCSPAVLEAGRWAAALMAGAYLIRIMWIGVRVLRATGELSRRVALAAQPVGQCPGSRKPLWCLAASRWRTRSVEGALRS